MLHHLVLTLPVSIDKCKQTANTYHIFLLSISYNRFNAMSQNPFSSFVHRSHTERHSSNRAGLGGSFAAIASIVAKTVPQKVSLALQKSNTGNFTYSNFDGILIVLTAVILYPLSVRVPIGDDPSIGFLRFFLQPQPDLTIPK